MKMKIMLFAILSAVLIVSFSCGSDDGNDAMSPDDDLDVDLPEVFSKFSEDLNIYVADFFYQLSRSLS